MNIHRISDGILYVGVNDRVKDRFEGLWPLPYGVSYNSYIVKGTDKVALIDTVEVSTVLDFLKIVGEQLDGRTPDYIIINHMEPDHSGSIPLIMAKFPNSVIVGNKQTVGMIKGYYNVDPDRILEIGDGSELNLGGKTLKFFLTPMVHWPETMMTFVPEDKVLFTGDAFGTFGALNGGVMDTEMETDWYFPEMYRYYSNIVGKYGKFVVRAIQKVLPLGAEYVCPTHGPVWHDRINDVAKVYSSLAEYKSEPGVTIVYGSMYGNTAEIAEAIGQRLSELGVRNIKIHNAAKSSMSDMISDAFRYEGLIVGGPTYSMTLFPPVQQFVDALKVREIKNKVVAVFGSYTWANASEPTLRQCFADMKIEVVDSLVMRQSSDDSTHEGIRRLASKVYEKLTL